MSIVQPAVLQKAVEEAKKKALEVIQSRQIKNAEEAHQLAGAAEGVAFLASLILGPASEAASEAEAPAEASAEDESV